ncbi:MAK16 protein [Salpingoeca rosetta]|uniref:Protein MAK16 homolog n=1 Tax=Salpingoeca rosetta (strain ATCC 50818 / BSB-021) TaxID=946362 RepID=F2TY05_SALR5|nr:MAK16 protein [Salpingoeca rosetta]EGD76264.1 MAK16 protein [Salpingoeca rosetta]|eukprot:XP_004998439.1 MAK16 protein [Salpingoeca rosetta]
MQHDQVIWSVINKNFCTFKAKTVQQAFCRHKYNVTGLCNRRSCPLANSNYATIREHRGACVIYLCIKTIERAHTPKHMWEKIKLKQNYAEALKQIDAHMQYWPSWLKLRCKQRLTKITQYLIRMRKLALKPQRKLITRNKKVERREARRELKALRAAHINKVIEKELLDRLKDGTYEGVYNFPENAFNSALDKEGEADEEPEDMDEEDEEDEEEKQADPMAADEFVAEYEEDEEDETKDMEDYDMEEGLDELFADTDEDEEDGEEGEGEDDDEEEDDDEGDGDEEAESRAQKKPTKEERQQALASAAALLLRRKARSRVSIEYEKEAETGAQHSSKDSSW